MKPEFTDAEIDSVHVGRPENSFPDRVPQLLGNATAADHVVADEEIDMDSLDWLVAEPKQNKGRGPSAARCPDCNATLGTIGDSCDHLQLQQIGNESWFRCLACFELIEDDRGKGAKWTRKYTRHKTHKMKDGSVACVPRSPQEYNKEVLGR